ncbi:hypothetical protein MMSP_2866 [Mycobacterium sp. 012931]|nr:hypothetical protein MMSP_2866 [Mycobacterium sp. 012931]
MDDHFVHCRPVIMCIGYADAMWLNLFGTPLGSCGQARRELS